MSKTRPHDISMAVVETAYEAVKKNRGAAGIDKETIEEFEKNAEDNLYKIWNRMSSGSYFPPPVRQVEIPKGDGKSLRKLGIPTVSVTRNCTNSSNDVSGTVSGTKVPQGLIRIQKRQRATGSVNNDPTEVLEIRLGHRPGYQGIL